MKKLLFLLLLATINVFAQEDDIKSKVTFLAKIENRNSDTLTIFGPYRFKQVIPINKEGVFTATFETKDGLHRLDDGVETTLLFFKNGYDLKLRMDAKEFDESIVYEGEGAKENNFIAQKALKDEIFQEKLEALLENDKEDVAEVLKEKYEKDIEDLESNNLDADLVETLKNSMKQEQMMMLQYLAQKKEAAKLNGTKSPKFEYENFKGGKTSLDDLKGKYVYIDVWATWCAPCRAEIPFLKALEKEFHGKKIEFVSISIDRVKDHDKWLNFVKENDLTGIQLFADNDWNSEFVKEYKINGIPRFILLNDEGVIVNADAPRPSSKEIKELFKSIVN
ncbi:TlpA family protein disulfide reductase [Flavobacterium sp.]|uniref:TlpA family protein disulfide reductase n=1 Tax=Flavobacterium sp. TaxID=239 RepID=UPI003528E88A